MTPKGESRRYETYMSLVALDSLSFGRCECEDCQQLSYTRRSLGAPYTLP